jgi:hypothetical protein
MKPDVWVDPPSSDVIGKAISCAVRVREPSADGVVLCAPVPARKPSELIESTTDLVPSIEEEEGTARR